VLLTVITLPTISFTTQRGWQTLKMFDPLCTYPTNISDFTDNKQYTIRKIYKQIRNNK